MLNKFKIQKLIKREEGKCLPLFLSVFWLAALVVVAVLEIIVLLVLGSVVLLVLGGVVFLILWGILVVVLITHDERPFTECVEGKYPSGLQGQYAQGKNKIFKNIKN